jgi:putative DNA-invertase from lambdoid prophage Rac
MPSTFIYSNRIRDRGTIEAELRIADHAGYTLDLGRTYWECMPATVSSFARPRMSALLKRARAGDTVVTMALSCLGWSVPEVLATIRAFRQLGVALHCLQLGNENLAAVAPPAMVEVLDAVASLAVAAQSSRVRESLLAVKAEGRTLGRPPKHSAEQRDSILRCLASGVSVAQTAKQFNTTRQTVLRIRTAAAQSGMAGASTSLAQVPASE